jgi:hypothetical protein
MASWLDSFGMGAYQAPAAIVEPKIQGSLLNEQTGAGAPVIMKNSVPNPQGIGDSTTGNYYKGGKALTLQDYTKTGSASEALKTAASNAGTNVVSGAVNAATHEATRLMVGALGIVLILIGGIMFAAGAALRSPATPMLAAGALAGGAGRSKPNTGNAGKGKPKGTRNATFELDIEGKKVPLKKSRPKKAPT